jgi:hypothetical protein
MASAVEPKKKGNVMYAFICSILASMASIILGYGTGFTPRKSSFFYIHGVTNICVHCWNSKTSG